MDNREAPDAEAGSAMMRYTRQVVTGRPDRKSRAPRSSLFARNGAFVRMVALTVVADQDYLALVRTSAMQVGALLDLPLPQVTDLRLAVDEACTSFLVPESGWQPERPEVAGARLRLCFDRYIDHLRVTVRGPAPPSWPKRDGLGWELLRAVVGEVRAESVGGLGILTLIDPLPS